MSGTSFKDYIIKKEIGRGDQGVVVLAVNNQTKTQVAIKMPSIIDNEKDKSKSKSNDNRNDNIPPEKLLEYQRRCLLHELDANQRIKHENVIKMHQIQLYEQNIVSSLSQLNVSQTGSISDNIAVVMEYCENGELYDYISDHGRFSEDLAKTYFVQLLKAIHACHSKGIYHRDVKLENILLDTDFRLKLADFGLCSILYEDTDKNGLLTDSSGTLSYMAPEVLKGKGYHGAPADIWSAGVVLFIMLAGYPPFEAPLAQDQWFRALETAQYSKFWKLHSESIHISNNAMALLNKIFVIDAKKRITMEGLFDHPWLRNYIPLDKLSIKNTMSKRRDLKKKMEQHIVTSTKSASASPSSSLSFPIQKETKKVMVQPLNDYTAVKREMISSNPTEKVKVMDQASSNIIATSLLPPITHVNAYHHN